MITTPILLLLLNSFQLKRHEKLPYLLSGALIATASSAPIGVSNIVNLISLNIIQMNLYLQTAMMFIPSMLGLLFLVSMLFLLFSNDIPKTLPPLIVPISPRSLFDHPLKNRSSGMKVSEKQMKRILLFVLAVRISLFVASYFHIPVEIVALTGSVLLLSWRSYALKIKPYDVLSKAPWHILVFAFGMYVIIYGLNHIGLSRFLVELLQPYISDVFHAVFIMGGAWTILANIFNNHPALMIGTLALTDMNLAPPLVKAAYLSMIIGSDIGSLLLPTGTLATLLWLHILKKYRFPVPWAMYIKTTILVIPLTVLFTLMMLYLWLALLFL